MIYIVWIICCVIKILESKTVEITLYYERANLTPDGFLKSVITVNGLFPGPPIRTAVGDTVYINVFNRLPDNATLSIHWHGISQEGSPWADGTAGISNCELEIGSNHTYIFETNESGTFWYHPHSHNPKSSRADGGYGVFVVEESPLERSKLNYDEERTIILSDWYHKSAPLIVAGLNSFGKGFIWPGNGDAILLNGVGMCTSTEIGCNNKNNKVYIDVKPNKIYRLRILNAASLSYFNIAISNHDLTIIKAGTTITKQTVLNSLDTNSGERFDVLIKTSTMIGLYNIQIQSNWRGNDMKASGNNDMNFFLRYDYSSKLSTIRPKNESKSWSQQSHEIVMPDIIPIPAKSVIGELPSIPVNLDVLISSSTATLAQTIAPTRAPTSKPTQTPTLLLTPSIPTTFPTNTNKPTSLLLTIRTVLPANKFLTLNIGQQYVDASTFYGFDYNGNNTKGYLRWTQNTLSLKHSKTSRLLASYYDMDIDHSNATKAIPVNLNDEVRIVIQNHAGLNGRCEQHP